MKSRKRILAYSLLLGLLGSTYTYAATEIDGDITASTLTVTGQVSMSSITITGSITPKAIVGVTDGSNAAVGNVGEYVLSLASLTSAPTSGTWGDLTSIVLSSGDWDVSMMLTPYANGGTVSSFAGGVGTASGNNTTGLTDGLNTFTAYPNLSGSGQQTESIPPYRVSISATTTFYEKVIVSYTGSAEVYGRLSARRVR